MSPFRGFRSAYFLLTAAFFLASGSAIPEARSCPGCSQLTEQAVVAEPQTVLAGFALSWSVLFMLAVVFSMLGLLILYIAKTVYRIDRNDSKKR